MPLVATYQKRSKASAFRVSKVIVLASVLAVLLIGISISAWQSQRERVASVDAQVRTLDVLLATDRLKIAMLSTLRGERGYLLTRDRAFLEPYSTARGQIAPEQERLRALVSDNRLQSARVAALVPQIDRYLHMLDQSVALEDSGRHDEAIAWIKTGEGKLALDRFIAGITTIEGFEHRMLDMRTRRADAADTNNTRLQYGLSLIGFVLLALAILAARTVAIATARERMIRKKLRRLAETDELTGLANRREFMAALDRAVASARRSSRPMALAIIDIDHFKRINDSLGHPAGDEVIREVAALAVAEMRACDIVGRIGGEEYAIVLPDCSPEAAFAACERLRGRIQSSAVVLRDGTEVAVSISTGLARYRPADNGERMIARADAALYSAKHSGRDQVRLAA